MTAEAPLEHDSEPPGIGVLDALVRHDPEQARACLYAIANLVVNAEHELCDAAARLGISEGDAIDAVYGDTLGESDLQEQRSRFTPLFADPADVERAADFHVRFQRLRHSHECERTPEQQLRFGRIRRELQRFSVRADRRRESGVMPILFRCADKDRARLPVGARPRRTARARRRKTTRARQKARGPDRPRPAESDYIARRRRAGFLSCASPCVSLDRGGASPERAEAA